MGEREANVAKEEEPIFRFDGKANTLSITWCGETKTQKVVLANQNGMAKGDTSAERTVSKERCSRAMDAGKVLAQTLLLENGCTELPVKVYPISKANGVKLKLTPPGAIENWGGGMALTFKQKPYAFVDPAYIEEYQHFTAAHELGHVLLGHVGAWSHQRDDGSVRVVQPRSCPDIESEANVFAGELLMPECVMMLCGVETAEDIAELCEVVPEDAEPVAERIRQRRQKGESFTPMEQRIVQRFLGYIQRTCKVTC